MTVHSLNCFELLSCMQVFAYEESKLGIWSWSSRSSY